MPRKTTIWQQVCCIVFSQKSVQLIFFINIQASAFIPYFLSVILPMFPVLPKLGNMEWVKKLSQIW